MLGLHTLQFDGNFLSGNDIGAYLGQVSIDGKSPEKGGLTEVDIAEASTADFTPNTVLVTHAKILETQKSVTVSGL